LGLFSSGNCNKLDPLACEAIAKEKANTYVSGLEVHAHSVSKQIMGSNGQIEGLKIETSKLSETSI
jgi:hypothetical protein